MATDRALDAPAKLRTFVGDIRDLARSLQHDRAHVCQYELRWLGGEQLDGIARLHDACSSGRWRRSFSRASVQATSMSVTCAEPRARSFPWGSTWRGGSENRGTCRRRT